MREEIRLAAYVQSKCQLRSRCKIGTRLEIEEKVIEYSQSRAEKEKAKIKEL
jgi:hypothetical protein